MNDYKAERAAALLGTLRELDSFMARSGRTLTLHGFVLTHGVGRYGARLPKGMRKLANRLCFQHAFQLAIDPRFIYCEGYATSGMVNFPLGIHAWVLDRERDYAVVDNTWARPIDATYLGIPMNWQYVCDTVMRKQTYSVIDNWQTGYPILRDDPATFLHPEMAQIPRDFDQEEIR
jgi:hypothetical protein